MSISMYDLSVPRLKHIMQTLCAILEKAQAFSEEKSLGADVLPATRLIADMYPLAKQVQVVSDQAKGCVARLAGLEPPKYEDNESTLPELIQRLQKTIDYVGSIKPEQIDGTEDKTIVLSLPNLTLEFTGTKYLLDFVIPNVYFHMTTAYNILRGNGMALGKRDFIGPIF